MSEPIEDLWPKDLMERCYYEAAKTAFEMGLMHCPWFPEESADWFKRAERLAQSYAQEIASDKQPEGSAG